MKIIIKTDKGDLEGEILKNLNPKTASLIINSLPLVGEANVWGEEIYFRIPISIGEENSQQDVEIGDLGFWPPGEAFCIFFGKTPVSRSDKPRAYSPVNVFGRITNGLGILKYIKDGETIQILKK